MRILITNQMLATRSGSELFTCDLAVGLHRAGWEVAVYSPLLGPLAEDLREKGVPVVDHPCRLPWAPHVIHGQHHLPTMVALCAFPVARALALIHGYHPWEEMALLHPRIRVYAVVAGRLKWWIARQIGKPEDQIRVIPNMIDPARFHTSLDARSGAIRRALVFSNYVGERDEAFAALRQAAGRCGIEVKGLGTKFDNASETPEDILRGVDVVFATGRSAIEALACGCLVVPYHHGAMGDQVTASNYEAYRFDNFTVDRAVKPGSANQLCATLNKLSREGSHVLPEWVLRDFSANRVVNQLTDAYKECLESPLDPGDQPESTALTNYLAELAATLRNDNARLERMRRGWAETKRKLARAKRERDELRQRQRAIPAPARRFWRYLRQLLGF